MESQHVQPEGVTVRRRHRKLTRPQREKTPDPTAKATNGRRRYSEDESSAVDGNTAAEEAAGVQSVRMQIRPPGAISAHESKILRRRDKTFGNSAARSLSQPREAERLTSPEADVLMRSAKQRSLSSPRHKDESSEEFERNGRPARPTADENISRLEQNLRRFEEERKRFESDKRQFEREKRENRLRYKQLHDSDERKRLLQNYRKLSDRIQLPADAEERRRMVHSLRLQRYEAPTLQPRQRHSGYEESSTQFSSSEVDDVEESRAHRSEKHTHPVRRQVSAITGTVNYVADVRGPPPQPPERRSVSRNHSLSPIRPQRRSKTPEQRAEIMRRLAENEASNSKSTSITPEPQSPATPMEHKIPEHTKVQLPAEMGEVRRRYSTPRKDSLTEIAKRRKQSLEKSQLEAAMLAAAKEAEAARLEEEARKAEAAVPLMTTIIRKIFGLFIGKPTEKPESKKEPEVHFASEELLLPQDLIAEDLPKNLISKELIRHLYFDVRLQWRHMKTDFPKELNTMRLLRNKCVAELILLILLCGFGGLMFRYTEGTSENIYKCEVRKVKRDFIDNLWTVSHNMREDDWKSLARQKLRKFEDELNSLAELGIRRYPGQKSWNFVNCILFCWTVITSIGYGHIAPVTTFGRTLAIVYAIIGIPLFLLILADYGKLFTRALKFLWVYVRRLYYTGTCRNIRKHQSVRDAMKLARRSSMFFGRELDIESHTTGPETPSSPFDETFEIDDEFNLPISVASFLLISYILIGALFYSMWENWTYFEAFYFVFISMSTIGFGDMVPKHPIFMMCSILYLVFGLALTSMFINVVQIKLSDTFKQASIKLSTTIGIDLPPDENAEGAEGNAEEGTASVTRSQPSATPTKDVDLRNPPPAPPRPNSNNVRWSESPPPLPSRKQEAESQEEVKKKGWWFW
uniref:TWiK family of potassium channels protein 7 n=1 Tax=Zeugodacus cucurbitae TaxID=28588 RepID=A0A0A1X648_ZEUCU